MDPNAGYAERLRELRAVLDTLEARSARISTLRGLSFLLALGLAGARLGRLLSPAVWWFIAADVAVFVGLLIAHAVLVTRMSELLRRVAIVERGQLRVDAAAAGLLENGVRFLRPGHLYARDLDLFGFGSLFQLVNATETGAAEAMLARWLSEPARAEVIAARQEAVRELAAMPPRREDLAVAGAASRTKGRDTEPFLGWAESPEPALSKYWMWGAQALVPLMLVLLVVDPGVGSQASTTFRKPWTIVLTIQMMLLSWMWRAIGPILSPVFSSESPFGRYRLIFRWIEEQSFRAPRLVALQQVVVGATASRAVTQLERIIGFAELRHAGIIAVLANVFLMWDVVAAARLLAWRARYGKLVRGWILAMAEIEALAALGTFAWEHPTYAFPLVDEGELRLVAEGLGHPLIPPRRCVVNDVMLPHAGTALMVSGSNMSGKSTLLRAIGINAVLAMAGAPVCATRFEIRTCQVYTSMRIDDSLERGVSHFYAEIERLKALVDAVNAGQRVLFLLDEVLHGTNSRERILGATAVITHLLDRGAIGAVSSHDLGLAAFAAKSAGRVTNVHLQELCVDDKMLFDYRIKPGVLSSSNALRLMKRIGIAVNLPDA